MGGEGRRAAEPPRPLGPAAGGVPRAGGLARPVPEPRGPSGRCAAVPRREPPFLAPGLLGASGGGRPGGRGPPRWAVGPPPSPGRAAPARPGPAPAAGVPAVCGVCFGRAGRARPSSSVSPRLCFFPLGRLLVLGLTRFPLLVPAAFAGDKREGREEKPPSGLCTPVSGFGGFPRLPGRLSFQVAVTCDSEGCCACSYQRSAAVYPVTKCDMFRSGRITRVTCEVDVTCNS